MTLAIQGARRPDETVGKYRIVSHLGQGGTAEVYLAVADGPSGFHKLVVLKVLKKSLADDDEFRAMFLNEARLAARLHHPNIVQTNEVLEDDGTPVMVMEYLEGQPLSQVIVRGREGGLTLPMQIRILVDALRGLHAAHELTDFDGSPLGVVHRDVSPHNIFVTLEGHAKVLDFGVAKLERSLVETEVGTIKGKLRYMAPEQIAGEKVDRRADVYAAGVILWEALAGERMWKGLSESEIRARVRAGDLPQAEASRPGVTPALARICRQALALMPANRYPTALALADELALALAEQGARVSHREIGGAVSRLFEDVRAQTREAIGRTLGSTSVAPQLLSTEPGTSGKTAPRRSRARRVIAAAGGAAIALALVLAATARQGGGVNPPSSTGTLPARADNNGSSRGAGNAAIGKPALPNLPRLPLPQTAAATSAGLAPLAERTTPVVGRASAPRITRDPVRRASWSARHSAPPVPPAAGLAPSALAGNGAPNAGADCAHPFFVDGNGIKKFRPECM